MELLNGQDIGGDKERNKASQNEDYGGDEETNVEIHIEELTESTGNLDEKSYFDFSLYLKKKLRVTMIAKPLLPSKNFVYILLFIQTKRFSLNLVFTIKIDCSQK